MLFSLASSDGDEAIFIIRGSILVFLSVLVSLFLGDAIATVSFGVVLGLKLTKLKRIKKPILIHE
jgi:hypothetical protein